MNRPSLSHALGALIIGLIATSSFTATAEGGGRLALYKPEDAWASPPWDLIAVIDDVDAGQPPRNMTNPPEYTIDSSPSWSPTGKQLVFHRYSGELGTDAIYRVDVDGSNLTRLLSSDINSYGDPKWGPRSTNLIAFTSAYAIKNCVTVMAPDGSGRRNVICPTGWDGSRRSISGLQWFPDGRHLLMCTARANNPSNLRRVNVATGKTRLLLSSDRCPARTSIAPDGKQLAVELGESIHIVDTATGTRRSLTAGTSPVFSPDGREIAFSKEVTANNFYPAFIIGVDGSNPRQVSQRDGSGFLSHAPLEWSVDGSRILVAEAWDCCEDFFAYSYKLVRTDDGSTQYLASDRSYELSLPNPWFEDEDGAIQLTNCTARRNLIGGQGEAKLYKLQVPTGTPGLQITTSDGTGDVSLYVSLGEAPSPTDAQYSSAHAGTNSEAINIAQAPPGTYYINVVGEQAYSGVNLRACHAP